VSEKAGSLPVTPIKRARLADLAYDSIRELIVSGRAQMGDRLVETQLSESLGISRAPIREALERLAGEGLVEGSAHHGAYITSLTAQDVVDLYNVRLGLETAALRLFMANDASTAWLHDAVRRMEKAARAGDRTRLVRAELDFHRHIGDGSGNALIIRLYASLEGRLLLALALDDALYERLGDVALEHVPVVEAIESGDPDHATRTLQAHIVSTVGALLERLEGRRGALLDAI
jgi:DNA-binding GntR family transcriptional regulator